MEDNGLLKISEVERQSYYHMLGRFVEEFAVAEGTIHVALWELSGAAPEVCQAVFSGTRARQAIDFMKRIREAKGGDLPPALVEALAQFGAINTMRDNILHFGTNRDEETKKRVVSNSLFAHTARSLKQYEVSPQLLLAAINDLRTICARLWVHVIGKPHWCDEDLWERTQKKAAATPWIYKPPQPASRSQSSPASTRPPEPQPRPFEA